MTLRFKCAPPLLRRRRERVSNLARCKGNAVEANAVEANAVEANAVGANAVGANAVGANAMDEDAAEENVAKKLSRWELHPEGTAKRRVRQAIPT